MKIYKLKNWLIILLISVASSGCTELYDESYNEIIADQFKPTEKIFLLSLVPHTLNCALQCLILMVFGVTRRLLQMRLLYLLDPMDGWMVVFIVVHTNTPGLLPKTGRVAFGRVSIRELPIVTA